MGGEDVGDVPAGTQPPGGDELEARGLPGGGEGGGDVVTRVMMSEAITVVFDTWRPERMTRLGCGESNTRTNMG